MYSLSDVFTSSNIVSARHHHTPPPHTLTLVTRAGKHHHYWRGTNPLHQAVKGKDVDLYSGSACLQDSSNAVWQPRHAHLKGMSLPAALMSTVTHCVLEAVKLGLRASILLLFGTILENNLDINGRFQLRKKPNVVSHMETILSRQSTSVTGTTAMCNLGNQ